MIFDSESCHVIVCTVSKSVLKVDTSLSHLVSRWGDLSSRPS